MSAEPTKRCSTCHEVQLISAFPPNRSQSFGVAAYCRPCNQAKRREYYVTHQAKLKENAKRWWRDGGEGLKKRQREYKKRNVEKLRQQIWVRYGTACVCCGESNTAFLTLDHIEGGGAAERRELGSGGVWLYRNLKKRGFPDGYQTMCFNCNYAKWRFGVCPHQVVQKLVESAVAI